jgi:RNA polymerase sigma-70 factor (ECF subfamily)
LVNGGIGLQDVQELVGKARQGDPDAFAALIERFERSALAVAYAQLHDAHRAGDAVQDAFLRAWQELPRLQDAARFGGWLLQIVRNAAIDLRRRVRPTQADFPDLASRGPEPAQALEHSDAAARIQAALASLDETTRTAVVLRYYEGLSAREIGEALNLSPAAVDMRLSRARGQLKELLAPLVEGPAAKDTPGKRPTLLGERV